MPVTIDIFRQALSRLTGGVTIVSTEMDGDRRGVTATAVCSVSAEPPSILICVNQSSGTHAMIEQRGAFAVSFLGEHHQGIAEIFAGRSGLQGDDRFAHGDWSSGRELNLPILASAHSALECSVIQAVTVGTHTIFFGCIDAAYFADCAPLLFYGGRFHSLPMAA